MQIRVHIGGAKFGAVDYDGLWDLSPYWKKEVGSAQTGLQQHFCMLG